MALSSNPAMRPSDQLLTLPCVASQWCIVESTRVTFIAAPFGLVGRFHLYASRPIWPLWRSADSLISRSFRCARLLPPKPSLLSLALFWIFLHFGLSKALRLSLTTYVRSAFSPSYQSSVTCDFHSDQPDIFANQDMMQYWICDFVGPVRHALLDGQPNRSWLKSFQKKWCVALGIYRDDDSGSG